ncbi:hypothetical protein ABZ826_13890 [Streptomyces sp. NPDC047515]|uniref:hypothetical protein n=1 Tax=Streptomyces sp. NPDC047515 TaxID=3155380 RepID=UPI0033DD7DA2
MTASDFYSDRLGQGKPRVSEDVSPAAWGGVVALIRRLIGNGSLACDFPAYDCSDDRSGHSVVTGVDDAMFISSLLAHVPDLSNLSAEAEDPFGISTPSGGAQPRIDDLLNPRWSPDTVIALDVIDFVARHIEEPSRTTNHPWNGDHPHYLFGFGERLDDRRPGQNQFQKDIDLLFARNGIAFTLGEDFRVQRLGPPEARPLITDFRPATGDEVLNAKLTDALILFVSRDPRDRRNAVEKLWDGFERLKTLELGGGSSKKASASQLLDRAACGSEPYREMLNSEFKMLTETGNSFTIRHHEHGQAGLPNDAAVDYLFVRLASVISYVLRATNRMAS